MRFIGFYFIFVLLLTSCRQPEFTIEDNVMTLEADGYGQTCTFQPNLFVQENGEWRSVAGREAITALGPLILNDEFIYYEDCDLVACNEITQPIQFELIEYKEFGEQIAGADLMPDAPEQIVKLFKTSPLSGSVKVEYEYFTDSECGNQRLFSTTIDR